MLEAFSLISPVSRAKALVQQEDPQLLDMPAGAASPEQNVTRGESRRGDESLAVAQLLPQREGLDFGGLPEGSSCCALTGDVGMAFLWRGRNTVEEARAGAGMDCSKLHSLAWMDLGASVDLGLLRFWGCSVGLLRMQPHLCPVLSDPVALGSSKEEVQQ